MQIEGYVRPVASLGTTATYRLFPLRGRGEVAVVEPYR